LAVELGLSFTSITKSASFRVVPAPGGKKPTWGGFAPQLLSFEICQQIANILKSDNPIPYINTTAQTALDEYRTDLGSLLSRSERSIKIEPDRREPK
jgi:ATP-dependent Lhr-like helicase